MKIIKKEVFRKFIGEFDVLIVDKNPGSRSRLIKIMTDLGSKRHMIHSAGTLNEATEIIKNKNVGLILSEYFIGGGSGFDLFKMIREKGGDQKRCLILVTADQNQSLVAKAAEEDVDSFIIKPYTVDSIQANLINTIADKIHPSPYVETVEEAKILIAEKKYSEAIELLEYAKTLHSKPALALFYIGQAEYLQDLGNQAQDSYAKGLGFNNIHYKCLVGLYSLLIADNKYHEAYQVVRKVAKFFPSNPDRLAEVIRLAIQTKNYQDMQMYYDIFTSLDERNLAITNHLGAGLYVSGKYFLMSKEKEKAMKHFENVVVSCSEFTKFTRAIITLLVEQQHGQEAEKFLSRFTGEDLNGPDFLVSDYLVFTAQFSDSNLSIKKGLDLYNKNIRDFYCMKRMVQAMKNSGYNDEKIEPFTIEMERLWPDKAV